MNERLHSLFSAEIYNNEFVCNHLTKKNSLKTSHTNLYDTSSLTQ